MPSTRLSTESRGGRLATDGQGLVRLCATGFVAYCSYAICRRPLLPLFARDLGAGPSMIGVVGGTSTLTSIFVKMPAGALSDILGRRPLLLAGALVFALMPFTYLGASSLAALIVLRVLHGSATAVFGPWHRPQCPTCLSSLFRRSSGFVLCRQGLARTC